MLMVAISLKLLAEIGFLALVGRGLLRVWLLRLHPSAVSNNLFLQILEWLCQPWLRLARVLTPKFVLSEHLSWVAALLLVMLWLVATTAKIALCAAAGPEVCL